MPFGGGGRRHHCHRYCKREIYEARATQAKRFDRRRRRHQRPLCRPHCGSLASLHCGFVLLLIPPASITTTTATTTQRRSKTLDCDRENCSRQTSSGAALSLLGTSRQRRSCVLVTTKAKAKAHARHRRRPMTTKEQQELCDLLRPPKKEQRQTYAAQHSAVWQSNADRHPKEFEGSQVSSAAVVVGSPSSAPSSPREKEEEDWGTKPKRKKSAIASGH